MIIDDRITQVALDGSVEVSTIDGDDERLRPFAASSAAVVDAALAGDDVTAVGQEQVGGVAATHYRVRLDEGARRALAALEPTELGWFQLEDPSRVSTIDVWVADDLIRRIVLTGTAGPDAPDTTDAPGGSIERTTVDYEDFGASIEITPLAVPESATPPA